MRPASIMVAALAAGCLGATPAGEDDVLPLTVTSTAFASGQPIPSRFTCEGEDVSPPLRIGGVPAAARSLVIVVDDPDAPRGLWTHWTAWNLSANLTEMPEGFDPASRGGVEGTTSDRSTGYHGPCPPGGTHRYFFRVYALDGPLSLPAGSDRKALDSALRGHVLAQGELMGTFAR